MSNNLKEFVILHSNDLHGKFAGETDENGKLRHSLSQTAGYVKKRKAENKGYHNKCYDYMFSFVYFNIYNK